MGKYSLDIDKDEKKALDFFDSSAACGDSLEFSRIAKEKAAALRVLESLRASPDTLPQTKDFFIAELFLFSFDNYDSAMSHMENIINDTTFIN